MSNLIRAADATGKTKREEQIKFDQTFGKIGIYPAENVHNVSQFFRSRGCLPFQTLLSQTLQISLARSVKMRLQAHHYRRLSGKGGVFFLMSRDHIPATFITDCLLRRDQTIFIARLSRHYTSQSFF